MYLHRQSVIAAIIILCGTIAQATAQGVMVLTNARIYTVDQNRSWSEAMAIDAGGVIRAVGSKDDILGRFQDAVEIDLGGRMILPGFQDVHLHAVEAGISAGFCDMPQFGNEADFAAALQDCRPTRQENGWVMGAGVNMSGLLDSVSNPLALIDAAVPDHPAIIIDDIGHGAWANSQALMAAGIDNQTRDPDGGMLIRLDGGNLSGVVLESLGQTLLDVAQQPTASGIALAVDSLAGAMEILAENGVTAISDAGGYWPRGHQKVWAIAEKRDLLSTRASNALYVYPDRPVDEQLAELKSRFDNNPENLVRFNQVKIYVDGILTQATSALYQPYEDRLALGGKDRMGFEYFPRKTLFRYARELSAAGFQLHFHATGDRGVGLALDAIAQSDPASGPHRITHLYMIAPHDRPRFARLGVVADFQIAPSSVDPEYLDYVAEFIGDRANAMLPLRSMIDAGALTTLSSDWDADEISPLIKLQTVLTRPVEAAPDLATAVEMMTINPARLLKHADRTGSIEPGKYADLVVLDRDIFRIAPEEIASVKVVATLLQGDPVYDPAGLFAR